MATGYDIRYSLLNDAKNMLFEKWNQEVNALRYDANSKQSVIGQLPASPTAAEIKALAEDLYEFVQRK
jgi:hypothetical protein